MKLEDYDNPVPSDGNHKHFGGGQTQTTIALKPGKHTLQLLLGDHNHVPHDTPVQSEVITITVKCTKGARLIQKGPPGRLHDNPIGPLPLLLQRGRSNQHAAMTNRGEGTDGASRAGG